MDYKLIQKDDELYHYGVLGMKWGKRKGYDRRLVRGHAGAGVRMGTKRQLEGDKADLDYLNKGGHLSVGINKKRQAAYDAKDKAKLEKRIAKNESKLAKKEQKAQATRSAVKDYSKTFNKASRSSDIADAKWNEVSEQYKALGKNKVSRMLAVAKNDSAAVKSYKKNFDEASRLSDEADAQWRQAKEKYKKTGSNYVSRVFNNIKYSK